ncbi:hypothetical protein [Desulfovibrio sp. ZJ200]|uniref:hypothetical protein n=1 Tax=Desulfovibrio sp. ZJ200 TaxID=2709792 RepID=UPI0013ED57FB|nr:hypothetical protein [Desulfovibrio sp. ZJ200]
MRRGVSIFILISLLAFAIFLPVRMGDGANSSLPIVSSVEEISAKQCRETLKKATVAYVSAKVINKILTSLQRIEISVQPFGIGISFAPGELLSAANDAIERVCAALFSVIGLMMVEKLTIGMISFVCFKVLLPIACILGLLHCLFPKICTWAKPTALFLAKLMVISWLFFPTVAVVTEYVENAYLNVELERQLQAAESLSGKMQALNQDLGEISEEKPEEEQSAWQKFTGTLKSIPEKFSASGIKEKITEIVDYADKASDNLFHAFCIFMLTTVVIPLFLLFIFYKLLQFITKSYFEAPNIQSAEIIHEITAVLSKTNEVRTKTPE